MVHHATRKLIVGTAVLAACGGSKAPSTAESPAPQTSSASQFEISYQVGWGDPAAHLYDIQIDLGKIRGDVVRLQMPVWSPGRYAPFYFARNVTGFSVTSGGAPVKWDRENGSLWRVYTGGAANLTVRYRVFANTLSGTFSVLDTAHATWNGPSLFL